MLLHGWASSYQDTWVDKGWIDLLTPIRQVIGVDQRGHGASDKPHDAEAYTPLVMAQDVVNLLDHLGIEKADVFGYSMGGGVAGALLGSHQERLRAVVMGGIGANFIDHGSGPHGRSNSRRGRGVAGRRPEHDPAIAGEGRARLLRGQGRGPEGAGSVAGDGPLRRDERSSWRR